MIYFIYSIISIVHNLSNIIPFVTAFHDCIGPNGCDGCINLENENNHGLEGIITKLSGLRETQGFTVRCM